MSKNQIGGGSADLYCILCGGPTYSREIITNIDLLKKYLPVKTNKRKIDIYYNVSPDGNWMSAEFIVDYIKKHNKKMDINDYNALNKSITIPTNHKWQNNLIMIAKDKIIKNVSSSCGEHYTVIDGVNYDYSGLGELGHLAHNDCYKLLSTKYGKFKFNDINMLIYSRSYYGLISKYQGQFFYSSLAFLENPYLLESPLKNKINKERILKLVLPINKKSDKIRPSPSESATLFNVGTKKKGNDGNIWIIKENVNKIKKWSKL